MSLTYRLEGQDILQRSGPRRANHHDPHGPSSAGSGRGGWHGLDIELTLDSSGLVQLVVLAVFGGLLGRL